MTIIFELDGRYFETRKEAETAEENAYYTYFPIKEHDTDYTYIEWEARFNIAKAQGASISDSADFAFSDLELEPN